MEYPENPTDYHDVVGIDTNTVRPVKSWPEFHAGFRHTGMVQVILDEGKDLFEIHLIPDSEGERKIIEDVYFGYARFCDR